jgi:hypothetical protein
MDQAHQAILKTLAYADVFNYPLTKTQLNRWLIWPSSSSPPSNLNLRSIPQTDSYYHLKHRQPIVKLRRQNQRFSQLKLTLAKKAVHFLKLIPSIKLIAITGALTMNNSGQHDDIDLMIITQTHRLWLTRLFSILLLELLHLRRRPKAKTLTNKICLNLFLDESTLKLPASQRNLYTAHEVCQIKPLVNGGQTYQKFLAANSWVKNYLPHALKIPSIKPSPKPSSPPPPLETLAYNLQLKYMHKKRTRERIQSHSAFFHPTSQIVLKQYHQKLKILGIK